jgi:hypothetical protein
MRHALVPRHMSPLPGEKEGEMIDFKFWVFWTALTQIGFAFCWVVNILVQWAQP